MIRWVSDHIGAAAFSGVPAGTDAFILDVRDLVDKEGNRPSVIRAKVDAALVARGEGRRVIVCCDYGISRSLAVAAGVLAGEAGIAYDEALQRVVERTGETSMRVEVVSAVRAALGDNSAGAPRTGSDAVLVTGGYGFLGSELGRFLAPTCSVVSPPRSELDLMAGAVGLEQMIRERQVGVVVHLAQPRLYTLNASVGQSINMLKNVCDACLQSGARLVYVSGWEVFSGYRTQGLLANETTPLRPGGTYGYAKALGEGLLAHIGGQTGLEYTIVRLSPVYGVTATRPRFVVNFVNEALAGRPIVTHRYLNGEPALDLLHVDDATALLAAVVRDGSAGIFHGGTGRLTTTRAVAESIVARLGSSSEVSATAIDAFAANVALDATAVDRVFGWQPRRNAQEGIGEWIDAIVQGQAAATMEERPA